MKYVRTKGGIYKNASIDKDIVVICRDRKCEVNPTDIVATADNIEELCDEFVLISPVFAYYPNRLTKDRLNDLAWLKKHKGEDCKNDNAYGAIWTDKGLVYVAKMNEKGELELL